jgi:endonuclease/exonuclease/phosphatase (EEP) superfamily protein YafD
MDRESSGGGAQAMMRLPRRVLLGVVVLATIGLAGVWIIAWIPGWPFALFEHFRVQYVVSGVVALAVAIALRTPRGIDAIAIVTLLHMLPIGADLAASPHRGPANGVAIRVLIANVWTQGEGFAQVRQLIADENPDVIGLVEVDRHWLDELAPALREYTGRLEEPRGDNFGLALYARGALVGSAESLGSPLPSMAADVDVHGTRLRVLLTHPMPPINGEALWLQERQLAAIAEQANAATGPTLVMGDFNATPWSRVFVRLLRRTGLCDSRAGFGVQASFPTGNAVLRIPIDHLLASCSIGVRDRRIGRHVGSDHFPVIVDLVVPR